MAIDKITIRGARQHNLKDISLEMPRNRLTVVTGLSGSGKSSLAFDTIYAEGQRRYVESLSAYARQFLDQLEKPDVDSIEGLSPAISIEQKTTMRSPRSTVGTVTEVYDYLRLLFSSIGLPHCPKCGRPISRQSIDQIVQQMATLPEGERVMILAPIVRGRKGEFKKELEKLARSGFNRARIDGEIRQLDEEIKLDKRRNHTIEVVIDRLLIKQGVQKRLDDSVHLAAKLTDGLVMVSIVDGEERLYSEKMACPECGISVPALEPRSFSFNSVYGAYEYKTDWKGAVAYLMARAEDMKSESGIAAFEALISPTVCPSCQGRRLQPASLAVRVGGRAIADYTAIPISQAVKIFNGIKLNAREEKIAGLVLREIRQRMSFLETVGLGYITLDRPSA